MKAARSICIALFLILVQQLDIHPLSAQEKKSTQPQSKANQTPYKFVGNKFSSKFHKPGCEFARKMNTYNVVLIKSEKEAESLNYQACNWCLPSWTKTVSSKVLEKPDNKPPKTE